MSVVPSDPPASPRELVQFAIDALEEERWTELARLADPLDLVRFYRTQLHFAESIARAASTPPSAEEIRRQNLDMSPAVAEHYAEISRTHHAHFLRQTFAGIDSVAELKELSPAEMLARFLQAHAQRWVSTDAAEMPDLPRERQHIVGEAAESDSLVHVVYRWELYQGNRRVVPEQVAVASVRRTPQGWRLRLTGELFGAALFGPEPPEGEVAPPPEPTI